MAILVLRKVFTQRAKSRFTNVGDAFACLKKKQVKNYSQFHYSKCKKAG